MGYEHINIELSQLAKHEGSPCGDYFLRKKTALHTTIILGDGKGHGIKAHIAATMYVTYLMKLLDEGYSLRYAFTKLIEIVQVAAMKELPYAVFSVARILNDGVTTILTYEMPAPVLISKKAKILTQRKVVEGNAIFNETNCYLQLGEGVLLMSDGVTQAGIGRGYNYGWGSENLCEYINEYLSENSTQDLFDLLPILPEKIQNKVTKICNGNRDDDVSVLVAYAKSGIVTTVFTGPPTNKQDDQRYIRDFLMSSGRKVICGGSTAGMISKATGRNLEVSMASPSPYTPPSYKLEGVDLAVEGAVTLNQLYNIIDADRIFMDSNNPVTQLYDILMTSDKIIFYLGSVNAAAESDISFIQRGIKTRRQIVPLIAEKLQELGKIVTIEYI